MSKAGRYRSPVQRLLSSSFKLARGRHVDRDGVRGYPIDFSSKALGTELLPGFLRYPGWPLWVAHVQRALGCYERYLAGDGDEWLDGARRAADLLLDHQADDGGWKQIKPSPHPYALHPPWVSAMAQGEAASLLVRMHRESGDARYAEAAVKALAPMR